MSQITIQSRNIYIRNFENNLDCSNKNVTDETPRSTLFSAPEVPVTEFIFEGDYFDQLDTDIIAPYLIVGGFVVFSGVLTILGGFCKLAEKLTDEQEEIVDRRKEGKVKNLLLFFVRVPIIYLETLIIEFDIV